MLDEVIGGEQNRAGLIQEDGVGWAVPGAVAHPERSVAERQLVAVEPDQVRLAEHRRGRDRPLLDGRQHRALPRFQQLPELERRRLAEDPKNATVLREALYEVTGHKLGVRFVIGEKREPEDTEEAAPPTEDDLVALFKETFDAREVDE